MMLDGRPVGASKQGVQVCVRRTRRRRARLPARARTAAVAAIAAALISPAQKVGQTESNRLRRHRHQSSFLSLRRQT